jgi:hypothetical protein
VVTTPPSQRAELDEMIAQYQRVGIAANELNRSMGLLDLVPEIVTPGVREKLRFIDQLVRGPAGGAGQPPQPDAPAPRPTPAPRKNE